MISRIVAKTIHVLLFLVAGLTCGCLFAELAITSKVKKAEGGHYDFSWLTYYLLTIAAMAALQTLLWIFQSRIYENGRPTIQECVLIGLFSCLYLFAAAWQFYQTFANSQPTEFMCSTNSYDETVHCRLWQAQLVGCAACGGLFFIFTIVWIVLFRSRHLHIKDLPEDYQGSPITAPSVTTRNDTYEREREQDREIAAEAERRRIQHHQQQHQRQQAQQQSRQVNPYQQSNNRMVGPGQLQQQSSSGYLNQGRHPYQQQRVPPQAQNSYPSVGNDEYYNDGYARQGSSFEMGQYHQQPISATPDAYSHEPSGYMETPSTSQVQYAGHEYPYGTFNPTETFEDPTSQEAQAHLAYANQLREQQLYHQNMAEVLTKQQQQKLQKQQQQQEHEHEFNLPPSSSTVNYPLPLQHSATMPPMPSNSSTSAMAGSTARATGTTQNYHTGMMTPGSNSSGSRPAASPQQYPDASESVYSDDRYKTELLAEVRRARMEGSGGSTGRDSADQSDYHDYKVQVVSEQGGSRPGSRLNQRNSGGYVAPPVIKSKTMWS